MTKYTKLTAAAIGAVLCLALTACASGSGATGDTPRAIAPSTGPLFVDLKVDVSASTAEKPLRHQYLSTAMSAVEAAVQRGGRLSIAAFFSRGLHPVELLNTPVPTPGEVGGVARAQQIIPIRNAAAGVLAEALGLARRRPEVASALKGIGGEATDVAGSFASGLAATHGQPDPVVVLLTDGEDAAFLGHYDSSPRSLAARIAPELPKVKHVTVALLGIGGGSATGTSTRTTDRLLATWRLACAETGARCYVAPDLETNRLFN